MIIAFDVDGTLINFDNTPNHEIISLLLWFKAYGDRIIIWSGGGEDYAKHWNEKLGLHADIVCEKIKEKSEELKPDICFDDEFVELAKVNYKIKPKLTPIN